jgi:L-aminoadipate-semialdehyde dehydrogenase
VFPYRKLKAANVIGTLTALSLATTGRHKLFTFVSSTSAMDTEHYVQLSDSVIGSGGLGVPENDNLEGSRTGLRTGYGQTKWVCEKLIMEAGKRGLKAHIIRPGYVVGHSKTAGEFIFEVALKQLTTFQSRTQTTSSGDWSRDVSSCN